MVLFQHLHSAPPGVTIIVATIGTGRFSFGARLQVESMVRLGVYHEFELLSVLFGGGFHGLHRFDHAAFHIPVKLCRQNQTGTWKRLTNQPILFAQLLVYG